MRPTSDPPANQRAKGRRGGRGSTPRPTFLVSTRPDGRFGHRSLELAVVAALLVVATLPARAWAQEASPAASPIVVTDDEGTEVALEGAPERIISLTPGTTEILFAIGAGDRVVATTDADDFPPEAVPLPDVASFGSVDLEAIVGLDPDLVVAGGNGYTPPDAIERLRSVGIPVIVIYAPTVDAVAEDIQLLGEAVGLDAEGAEVAASLREGIEALSATVRDLPHPKVFYEVDATVEIYGPADDSFLAVMVALAGGVPVTSGSALSFQIPLERLVAEDPEIIVLGDAAYGTTPEVVAARPGWGEIAAVRDGAVRPLTDDILVTRPGPRLPDGLRALIEAIHPDALP